MSNLIHYQYTHQKTEATTGYFSCLPEPRPGHGDLLALIAACPLDSFLRRYALNKFAALNTTAFTAVFESAGEFDAAGRKALKSFLQELALLVPLLQESANNFAEQLDVQSGISESPLLYLRRAVLPDAWLHAVWAEIFNENLQGHRKLETPEELAARGVPKLFTPDVLERFAQPPEFSLVDIASPEKGPELLMEAAEVAELALERLREAGAVAGVEQRHTASLSPIALLMPWELNLTVHEGRNNYTLTGQANTYGRGLSLPQARASCRMEMVERFSAYLSINGGEIKNRATPTPVKKSRRSDLLEQGESAIDPNSFYVEVPYQNEELLWVKGLEARYSAADAEIAYHPVWVPLQLAALFNNCDEIDLCSAPGSTGIATGSIMAQARLAALTEILERDSESTILYNKSRCFQLDPLALPAEEPYNILRELLIDYRTLGINLQFMDLTGALGLPCYQAFVIGPKGQMHRGHGASLSGARALISAITETPYPYPDGGFSGPLLRNLPVRKLSDLPDYSCGSASGDLARLETLLCRNGLNPVYVDLTHATLKFPVVRALIPGMQLAADFDDFTRISPRLYKDYLDLYRS